jgi:hypothetical protein
MKRPVPRIALAATLAAAALAGCGLSVPGHGSSRVTVTVTGAFGEQPIARFTQSDVSGSATVLRLLEGHLQVRTRLGGRFVESIDGRAPGSSRSDWFFYVNGVQQSRSAARVAVHPGDHIWWDLHDWSATNSIPAVAGSFPEPFVHGIGGQRYPTVLECANALQATCDRIGAELRVDGVPTADQLLGTGSGSDSLTIVVAPFSALRGTIAGTLIASGPSASGVYARFAQHGSRLELLNPRGQTAEVLSSGSGLIAATQDQYSKPEWLITGTDPAGVRAAAAALTPAALHDHFALAVAAGRDIPLPLEPTM